MISIAQVKLSNLPAKPCAFGPTMKRILKIFKKIVRFFDQNLYGKLTFFHNFVVPEGFQQRREGGNGLTDQAFCVYLVMQSASGVGWYNEPATPKWNKKSSAKER